MTMNRRKFFGTVSGLAAAVALPQAAAVAAPSAPVPAVTPTLSSAPASFVETMKAVYAVAIRNVWDQPNDAVTRLRISSCVVTSAEQCRANRGVMSFEVISDERNNPASIVNSNGNRVTVVYIPLGHVYPRQLDMEFHAARRDPVTGEHYSAHFTFKDRGIDGATIYEYADV